MKTKENNKPKMVSIPEKDLLTLVGSKLKDRVLFPEKVANLKQDLRNIAVVKH